MKRDFSGDLEDLRILGRSLRRDFSKDLEGLRIREIVKKRF